jgi:general secretion pathway protein E
MNQPRDPLLAIEAFVADDIRAARAHARAQERRLLDVLQERMGIDAATCTARLAHTANLPVADMALLHRLEPAFERLPFAEALQRECVPLHDKDGGLLLAISDPFDPALRDWIGERLRGRVELRLAHHGDISAYLARHEESLRAMDGLVVSSGVKEASAESEDLSLKRISEDTSPVVKLVNSTLYDALKIGASDIHLETGPAAMVIKYRVDGVLTTVGTIQGLELAEQIISRIKVLAELDIAERRVPQDGRFKVSARGREIDLRVSVMPSIHGEDAVLRILDKQHLSDQVRGLRLDSLGFDANIIATLRRLSREPYGMMLVTGPTGSGKTTTLYAAISEINHGHDKIITIEDPVEYQLPGVLQIPVNEKKGLTFARGLRSILRHDPDRIMVGEIRDGETAQIAVQAALTGHLVFTTVHANNVFDVIGRFMHMGVDPYNLVSALNAIVAQRLVRLNCPSCTVAAQPAAQILAESGIGDISAYGFRSGRGCGQCRGTGYKGRNAIAEMLVLDDELRELIVGREPLRRLKEAAVRKGMRGLREAGLALVAKGVTSLEELNRVTFVA